PAGPNGTGGGGFDAQWYTEFQHKLVRDNGAPGLIQAAADGKFTNMDQFMDVLVHARGLGGWAEAQTMISNHDEVGNAERTINTADGSGDKPDLPSDWARGAARFAAGVGFTSPGIPMFFQGDESLADNDFDWDIPSKWDIGWTWKDATAGWDMAK